MDFATSGKLFDDKMLNKQRSHKRLTSSYDADMGGLEGINDRMKNEMETLLTSLEAHLEKAKENKRKYLESKMQTEGLYNQDEGILISLCLLLELHSAQYNVKKLEKDIKRMK